MAAAHRAEQRYGAALLEIGFALPDFLALAVVVQIPGATVGTIAFRLGMSHARASDLSLHLEGSGWVERVPTPRDLRRKAMRVTREGAIAYEEAITAVGLADSAWQDSLSDAERTALRAALLRLVPNSSERVGLFTLAL
jgi:DNA-binding MarR family transcriptional regulator